ncbi:hypothetical protein ABW21_db0207376 [Orbilia brochopaga]|nr:hypothetical protein ABW21_db0207376 [Drechslerella brochopaga]
MDSYGTPQYRHAEDQPEFVIWEEKNTVGFVDPEDRHCHGSRYPVAVNLPATEKTTLDLLVAVPQEYFGVPFRIHGELEMSGGTNNAVEEVIRPHAERVECFLSPGPHKVPVVVSPSWARNNMPWGLAGDISWKLYIQGTNDSSYVESPSRIEFYALREDLPHWVLDRGAVPVALAREFVLSYSQNPSLTWEEHCARIAFHTLSFRYDSKGGRAWYCRGAGFQMGRYLDDKGKAARVNCVDQAMAMRICMELSPSTTGAFHIRAAPFGYIEKAALVGQGTCNNPFFEQDRCYNPFTLEQPDKRNCRQRVCRDIPCCSGFSCHWFVALKNGNVVDSCCGPHPGKENIVEFMEDSIHGWRKLGQKLEFYEFFHVTWEKSDAPEIEQRQLVESQSNLEQPNAPGRKRKHLGKSESPWDKAEATEKKRMHLG